MEPRGAGSAGTLGSGSPSRGREDEDGVGGGVPERCPCGGAQLTLEPGPGERPCACPHPGGREREGEQAAFLTPDARRVQTLAPRAGTAPVLSCPVFHFQGRGYGQYCLPGGANRRGPVLCALGSPGPLSGPWAWPCLNWTWAAARTGGRRGWKAQFCHLVAT